MTSSHQLARDLVESAGLFQAKVHVEQAAHHDDQVAQNLGAASAAKSQGNKALAGLHTAAADHHKVLSAIHTDLAQAHLRKVKSGAQPIGEGFAARTLNPDDLYKPFDPREKVDYTPNAPKNQHFILADLRRVVENVCAKHGASLQVLRFLEDEGFLGQVTSVSGMYPGTSPSCTQLEQDFVKAIRAEHPPGIVELLDQTTRPPDAPGGYSSRQSVWRFRLGDRGRTVS